jgi:hypothetical protein
MADKGLSARTHDNRALLERWRAQCGMTMNYTAAGEFAYLPRRQRPL